MVRIVPRTTAIVGFLTSRVSGISNYDYMLCGASSSREEQGTNKTGIIMPGHDEMHGHPAFLMIPNTYITE